MDKRLEVIDALRGFALLGIISGNLCDDWIGPALLCETVFK